MNQKYNMIDYDKTFSEFKWEIPEHFNFARDIIDTWADNNEKLALWCVDDYGHEVKKTFHEISKTSKKFANVLTDHGIKAGDVVLVILGRTPEWWEIFIACLRMAAIITPGTTQLTSKDLEYRINQASAKALITDSSTAQKFESILDQCPSLNVRIITDSQRCGWINYHDALKDAPEDFITRNTQSDEGALIYFTSGTSGYPKMTLHTHASYPLGHQVTGKWWLDLTPDDLHWNISDTGWAKAAWSSLFGPWYCGTTVFIHKTDRFDPLKTIDFLEKYPITTMCAAPTVYRMLVQHDLSRHNFSKLRHCTGAGEPLNPETINAWHTATDIIIRDGYGQTETVCLCGNFPCLNPRPGSMGKPTPGFDLQIIDETGSVLPAGQEGNIAVRIKPKRPLGLFKEYWHDPERTAAAFRGEWYLTGDRAFRDADGFFWFVGRADDVILTSGYRIGPFEVESALLEHPAVVESAVVSSPDTTRGEIVKAFVVLTEGYTPDQNLVQELQDHVKALTAPYKYPRKIEFVDALPKTISGKVRRSELRKREWKKK